MRKTRLADVLSGLKRAAKDPRVKALIVKIGGNPIGLAMVQELRQAVVGFRASGKLTVAFGETFGEFGGGTVPYYLASAFERVYLQPSGDIGLTGVALEQRFVKGALTKLGVDYEMAQRHEYKTAANTFTQDHMTEPHRESMARIVGVGHRAARRRHRRGPPARSGQGPRAHRPRPVHRPRGPGGRAGRRAGLPGRGVRRGQAVHRRGHPPAVRLPLPARRHRPQAAAADRRRHRPRARHRPDPHRPQRPQPARRGRRDGLRHDQRRPAGRPPRRARQGRRLPGRQPRRLVRRLRHRLARGRAHPQGEAGHRLDGRPGGLRRLLRRHGRRRDRRPARHADRLDRRLRRQAGARASCWSGSASTRSWSPRAPTPACSPPRAPSRRSSGSG